MRRIVFAIVMCVLFVGTSLADINQNLGVGAELFAVTAGPAQAGTQIIVAKAQDAATGWQMGSQNIHVLGAVNALSGQGGMAMADVGGMTILGQNIGANSIVQQAVLGADINTAAAGNGTASATYAVSTNQAALNMGSFAVDGMIVAGVSVSSAMQIPCTPPGIAASGAAITAFETTSVVGRTPCGPPAPSPCDPCQ